MITSENSLPPEQNPENEDQGRDPEKLHSPTIKLYRAITGEYKKGFREGVEKPFRSGFFGSNGSLAQSDMSFAASGLFGDINPLRRVAGWPVFLEKELARNWLIGKASKMLPPGTKNQQFLRPPILAELRLPLGMFIGEDAHLRIVANTLGDASQDRQLSEEELKKVAAGEVLPVKECYLTELNGELVSIPRLTPFQHLYQPKLLEDGQIDLTQDWVELEDPDAKPQE